LGTLVVEVEAEDGTCGVGITIGGNPGAYIVEHHLSRFVEGEDPRNVELMWDKMWRSTINYGRKVRAASTTTNSINPSCRSDFPVPDLILFVSPGSAYPVPECR
jgi:hypothetical protein